MCPLLQPDIPISPVHVTPRTPCTSHILSITPHTSCTPHFIHTHNLFHAPNTPHVPNTPRTHYAHYLVHAIHLVNIMHLVHVIFLTHLNAPHSSSYMSYTRLITYLIHLINIVHLTHFVQRTRETHLNTPQASSYMSYTLHIVHVIHIVRIMHTTPHTPHTPDAPCTSRSPCWGLDRGYLTLSPPRRSMPTVTSPGISGSRSWSWTSCSRTCNGHPEKLSPWSVESAIASTVPDRISKRFQGGIGCG